MDYLLYYYITVLLMDYLLYYCITVLLMDYLMYHKAVYVTRSFSRNQKTIRAVLYCNILLSLYCTVMYYFFKVL